MKRYLLDTNILIYYLADAVQPEKVNETPALSIFGRQVYR